jgi:hypothetical protein
MSMREMDYFDKKPDLDMKAFFEGRAIKLAGAATESGVAPPPKDLGWAAQSEEGQE